ncbi:Tat pathway signal protein [Streptomyces sp. GQFP]|uniref:Tat pathway signal protein n=1 Tax=Streptomyces sp. GQFP TaxID=2907545 RepID=UPI001F2E7E7B|nr:Tat pathway signal protein [Streptomyces sp. GQFP]UIX29195.1 Tat pathway signal protein [Streptomyces sp. GQFP]
MPASPLSRRHFVQIAGATTAAAATSTLLQQAVSPAYAGESAQTGKAGLLDHLVLGDEDSEAAHAFTSDGSETITDGNDVRARVATPLDPVGVRGGELRFTVRTDPVAQNYLTLKLWGGDSSPYVTLAYLNGEQIGFRRNSDYEPLSFGFSKPAPGRFTYQTIMLPLEMTAGREQVEITLRTYEGSYKGTVTANSRTYYGVYTHTAALLDVFGEDLPAYQPPTGTPDDVTDEQKQDLIDGLRTAQVALFGRLSAQVDASASGNLSIVRYTDDLRFYAGVLTTDWSPASTPAEKKTALLRLFKCVDNHVKDYYGNTRLLLRGGHQGDWGGYYGALGEALYIAENLIGDDGVYGADAFKAFLDEEFTTGTSDGETSLKDVDFDGGKLTRRAAWGRCLKANFDFARSRLSLIYNQVLFTYEGAWEAHEGLRVIGSPFYEGKKRSHAVLGETLGLVPFLGEEVLVGPDGADLDLYHSLFYHDGSARFTDDYVKIVAKGLAKSKLDADGEIVRRLPYGKHYTGLTAAGLTRENTYVGNYGEEASRYLSEYFFKTWGHEGDENLNDEILKLTLRNSHARGHTRYPADDGGDNRLMRTEGVIDERNVYVPGIPGYSTRINQGQSLYLAAVEAHMAAHADRYAGSGWGPYWEYAREAVGFTQQQLADRQYFNQFNVVTQWLKVDLRLVETWAYLTGGRAEYDRFGTVKAKKVLPQTDFRSYSAAELAELGVDPADYEQFAWVDIDNMFVSLRDGDTRVFGSLFVQNRGISGSGRLHVMAPAYEHTIQLRTDGPFQFRDYWARTDNIDADFMEDINTGDNWAPQALTGEICPIAYQPGVGKVRRENFEADTPYSGYIDFLTARYGPYLFGINTTRQVYGNKRTHRLAVPAGHRGSTVLDLVSGKRLPVNGGKVTVPPFTAVVLKLSEGADEILVPSVVRYAAALPGDTYIGVTWTPTAGASSYTVRRATREDGEYETVAAGLKGLYWRDEKVQQGRRYFYTVTAVNSAGSGLSSWRAEVEFTAPVSRGLSGTGWRDDRLGSQKSGRTSVSGARITLAGGDGTGLGKGDDYKVATRDIEDSLLFVSRVLAGTGTVTARVDDHKGALTGLMLRDRIDADTRYLYFGADTDGKLVLSNRDRDSRHDWQDQVRSPRDAGIAGFTAADYPYLRLIRDYETHQVLAFASPDGTSWTYTGSMLMPLPYAVHAGVAGSGDAVLATVRVRDTEGGALLPYVAKRAEDTAVVAWNKPEDATGFTLFRTADADTAATNPLKSAAGWDKVLTDTRLRGWTEKELRHGSRWFKVAASLAGGGTTVSEDAALAVAETLAQLLARARKTDASDWTRKSYAAFTAELDRIEKAGAESGADQDALIDEVYAAYDLLETRDSLLVKFPVTAAMVAASTIEWPGTGTKASNGWKAFDGNTATYADTLAAESWIDVDAGDAGPVTIDKIRFYPRSTHLTRANGTVFRGSDDGGATWTDLHTVSGVSAAQWYEVKLAETASYPLVRVYDNHDGRCNVSEIEFLYYGPDEA